VIRLRLYIDPFDGNETLVFECSDPVVFLKDAPKAFNEKAKGREDPWGLLEIIVDDMAFRFGFIAVTAEGKLHGYLGQGLFRRRSIGPVTLRRYVERAEKWAQEDARSTEDQA
jgi:hypothetical protein